MIGSSPLHQLVAALSAVIFLIMLWAVVRIVNSASNDLEWTDLISVPGRDGGRQRADWNSIGKGLGVVLCVWIPGLYAYSPKMDAGGLALVMTVALGYLGGVSSYASWLRSKQGTVETTRITEPADAPAKVTESRVEIPPIASPQGLGA